MPKFSLVLATIGRSVELQRFLQHLDAQTYREFELIIVDQNSGNDLDDLLHEYLDRFPVVHLRSEPGLSRARNIGLQHISGDIVAFPDDDCWYAPNLLERIAGMFQAHPEYDGLSGAPLDDSYPDSFPSFPRTGRWIGRRNVWLCANSITIFLRRSTVRHVGKFDECLGVGSNTTRVSGEETDYLIRAIDSRFKVYYCPDLYIFHPYPHAAYDATLLQRGYSYSLGFGYVLRKHNYPALWVFYYWLRALSAGLSSLLMFDFKKSRYHFAVLRGRVLGWIK